MAKRIRYSIKEGPTRSKSSSPPLATFGSSLASSGMIESDWNAAVRFQCAVRDAIDRPVSLAEALNFGRILFGQTIEHGFKDVFRKQFDQARQLEQQTKEAAAAAARKHASD